MFSSETMVLKSSQGKHKTVLAGCLVWGWDGARFQEMDAFLIFAGEGTKKPPHKSDTTRWRAINQSRETNQC